LVRRLAPKAVIITQSRRYAGFNLYVEVGHQEVFGEQFDRNQDKSKTQKTDAHQPVTPPLM
jgi:hypothetical protein